MMRQTHIISILLIRTRVRVKLNKIMNIIKILPLFVTAKHYLFFSGRMLKEISLLKNQLEIVWVEHSEEGRERVVGGEREN